MTNEDALYWCEKFTDNVVISNLKGERMFLALEAMKQCKEALGKQIPQFVLCPNGFQGVRQTRFYCPSCKAMTRDHEKFCHKCGQAVKYPKAGYSKAENKIVLDWRET